MKFVLWIYHATCVCVYIKPIVFARKWHSVIYSWMDDDKKNIESNVNFGVFDGAFCLRFWLLWRFMITSNLCVLFIVWSTKFYYFRLQWKAVHFVHLFDTAVRHPVPELKWSIDLHTQAMLHRSIRKSIYCPFTPNFHFCNLQSCLLHFSHRVNLTAVSEMYDHYINLNS